MQRMLSTPRSILRCSGIRPPPVLHAWYTAPLDTRLLLLCVRRLGNSSESKGLVESSKKRDDETALDAAQPLKRDGLEVKVWGSNLELPEVSKKEAENSYLDATDVTRAIMPPMGLVNQTRDDFSKDRFNYVSTNLNPASQYVVMGGKNKVAPVAVSQGAIAIASLLVLMSAITSVLYIKKEWQVTSFKELGDRLREKGSARREAIESGNAAMLVRTVSQTADTTVKGNVDLIRRPTQQMAGTLTTTFQGGVVRRSGASEEGQ
uniref:Uncharacterized protein n=1 Tax=Coccolithus braarudii TaxID=221442 RepID=A0A7S0LD47_9EUKA